MMLPPRKPPEYMTQAERERILTVLSNRLSPRGRRNYALFALMFLTGLRVSEVCHLTVEDVDLDAAMLYVREGKGRKDRRAQMTPRLIRILRLWLAIRAGLVQSPQVRRSAPPSARGLGAGPEEDRPDSRPEDLAAHVPAFVRHPHLRREWGHSANPAPARAREHPDDPGVCARHAEEGTGASGGVSRGIRGPEAPGAQGECHAGPARCQRAVAQESRERVRGPRENTSNRLSFGSVK